VNRLNTFLKNCGYPLAACIFFFLCGVFFLPHLGLQNDEAIIGDALFQPIAVAYSIKIGHSHFALMLMTYLGTLKAWLYRPLFQVFGVTSWSLRIP
jgi:hypothetical protein